MRGRTALIYSAMKGLHEATKLLVKHGADILAAGKYILGCVRNHLPLFVSKKA